MRMAVWQRQWWGAALCSVRGAVSATPPNLNMHAGMISNSMNSLYQFLENKEVIVYIS